MPRGMECTCDSGGSASSAVAVCFTFTAPLLLVCIFSKNKTEKKLHVAQFVLGFGMAHFCGDFEMVHGHFVILWGAQALAVPVCRVTPAVLVSRQYASLTVLEGT